MIKLYQFFILFLIYIYPLQANNELYINGPVSASATATLFDSTCILFVNGEIKNIDGLFINSGGSIELTGNWTNTITNNKYQSTGTEKFYGTAEQVINGTMNGITKSAAGFDNQFYNLKVYRNSTITTTPAKYITLNNSVNVANTIDFENSTPNATYAGAGTNKCVIRTDPASPANVGTYSYELYLENPLNTALTNYAAISANGQDRYIEGKLRRQVNAIAAYDFPIGFSPNTKDGMEGFSINFNAAPSSQSIIGFIEDQSQALINDASGNPIRNVLCDVGKDPGAGNDPFPNCVGPPDGILDLYYLDSGNDLTHEWVASRSGSGPYNYDITLYPGTILDDLSKYKNIPVACGAPYQTKLLRVLAKDGIVGGTSQFGPVNMAPFRHLTSFIWCSFPAAGTQAISLTGQTSFSKFRIHGTNLFSSTALPVELTNFSITPVSNSYFQLDWNTASELNNKGFEILRSEGSGNFYPIGFVEGNGTSNIVHNYTINDKNVLPETDYYYKLKIIDFDGKFTYSRTLRGRLRGNNTVIISDFFPNPASEEVSVNIYSPDVNSIIINLYDVLGQPIFNNIFNLNAGWNKVDINLGNLAAATYIANVQYNGKNISKKIVKK